MQKNDLLSSCNDQNIPEKDFTGMFCRRCKNRSCERAGWAFSSWDERINTQVDRLILNPNIISQKEASRWEGLSDLETLPHQGIIEVWGAKSEPTPPKPALFVDLDPKPLDPKPVETNKTGSDEPKKKPVRQLNVPAKNVEIHLPSHQIAAPVDEWAVPPKTLKVGATFKMGDSK
jgi:hypothetical protein